MNTYVNLFLAFFFFFKLESLAISSQLGSVAIINCILCEAWLHFTTVPTTPYGASNSRQCWLPFDTVMFFFVQTNFNHLCPPSSSSKLLYLWLWPYNTLSSICYCSQLKDEKTEAYEKENPGQNHTANDGQWNPASYLDPPSAWQHRGIAGSGRLSASGDALAGSLAS